MIRLLVFDLGNVILPFEHHQIAEELLARNRNKDGRQRRGQDLFQYLFDLERGAINPYEEGLISTEEFFSRFCRRFDLDIDFADFSHIWNHIFREDREVSHIVRSLKEGGYPLFLLSNTNELHFSHIIEHYPVVHLMDEWILSFEVGAKKPSSRIFEAIFEKVDVRPDEVFYIDDVAEYVAAAGRFGIKGTVFTGAGALRETLKIHGIDITKGEG
jgi:glucose-1-phosphatase